MASAPNPGAPDRERLTHDAIDALIRVSRRHHQLMDQRVEDLGLHRSQSLMLFTLSRMGRTASQKAIADRMGISPAAVARTLKSLEAEGYVEKVCGDDGRRNEISLLPAGQARIDATHSLFRATDLAVFEGISDADVAAMTASLRRALENIARLERRDDPKGGIPSL